MLTKEEKDQLIKEFKVHEADTGSAEVQVALLTEEIRSLLNYLQKEDEKRYKAAIKKLGLKR